jgi:hypothetical protein
MTNCNPENTLPGGANPYSIKRAAQPPGRVAYVITRLGLTNELRPDFSLVTRN